MKKELKVLAGLVSIVLVALLFILDNLEVPVI
jgi:hypothetical protein